MTIRTEKEVLTALRESAYKAYMKEHYPKQVLAEEKAYWNPKTGSCGFHARFTLEALGVQGTNDYEVVESKDISKILSDLDKGKVMSFLHDYRDWKKYNNLPKDNRYGNHMFVLVKGGTSYFLSQGYLHRYRHSLTALSREEVEQMFTDLLNDHSDYETKKVWSDLNLGLHKKYFKVPLRLFPDEPVPLHRNVNGIVLLMETTK
jgi:hypothetical protein